MPDAPPAAPPGTGAPPPGPTPSAPPAPPAADPPQDPSTPSREDVIRDPQALLDVLATTRDNERRQARRIKDFERAERERADASRTELERVTDRATTAEGSLAGEQLGRLRLEVALEQLAGDNPAVQIAMAMAPRLQGNTREELLADAGKMRQLLGQQPPPNGNPPPPGFDFGSGSRLPAAGAPASGTDANFNAALRRAAGR